MTKPKQEEKPPPLEAVKPIDVPPVSEWETVVRLWADKKKVPHVAKRLREELAKRGITSVEMLANSPIKLVTAAARAALQADAQALLSAAYRVMEDK